MTTRRMLLRAGLTAGALAAGGSALAGCSDTSSGGPSSSSTGLSGTAQVSWWGGDDRAKTTQELLTTFTTKHEGTTLKGQFTDWSNYWQKLSTMAAGGNLPDVMQMSTGYVAQFARNNQLAELDVDSAVLDLKGTDPQLLSTGTVDGTLRAIGAGGTLVGMGVNTTLLGKTGMTLPEGDISWDDLGTLLVELQAALPENAWATDAAYSNNWFSIFIRQQIAEMYDEDGKIAYTKDMVVAWLSYWRSLQDKGVVVPNGKAPNAGSGNPADTSFALGMSVLTPQLTNLYPTTVAAMKDETALRRAPTGGQQAGDEVSTTMQWSVAANSKNPELAMGFIGFMLHDPDAIKAQKLDRGIPGDATARGLIKPLLSPAEQQAIDMMDAVSPQTRVSTILAPEYDGEISDALERAGEAVSLGKSSPADAADQFWTAAQKAQKG